MKGAPLALLVVAIVFLTGAAAATVWVLRAEVGDFRPVRTTGERADVAPAGGAGDEWHLRHEFFGSEAPQAAGDWPCFRGPDRDAVCKDAVKLADKWPEGGPRVLWRVQLGEGHAGAAVRNGRAYVMDYEPPPYLLLRDSDIADWDEFCRQLVVLGQSAAKTPQRRVWELLSGRARDFIAVAVGGASSPGQREVIISALNEVVRDGRLYRSDYFPNADLSSYLRQSLTRDPVLGVETVSASAGGQKVLRINRTLFEQAFGGLVRPRWKGDVVRCFSLATGEELWRTAYRVRARIEHGVSRAVPAVTDKHVVTLGPRCQVACFDAETGKALWRRKYPVAVAGVPAEREFPYIDLVREYETRVPDWHAAQCPLIDAGPDGRELAIFAPGGKALFVAVDCATGDVVWQTPTPPGWKRTMTHSSIMPMTFAGKRMYVYAFREGVAAVSADDGELLWSTTEWKNSVIAPSPLALPDGRLFFTAGFGGGSVMLQLSQQGDKIIARRLFAKREAELSCYQQTPVYYGGLIYMVLTAGRYRGRLACVEPAGKVLWYSGGEHRFAWGPFAVADGKMYLLRGTKDEPDNGLLTMARVSRRGFEVLGRARVLDGDRAWAPIAFAGGLMLVRDETEMVCLDLMGRSP